MNAEIINLFDPAKPVSTPTDGPVYDRNGVRRSKDGRPYVQVPCPDAGGPCVAGRIAGKRPDTTKQCPKCKGRGVKEVLYSRCTSFVGVLEARKNLEAWQRRITLLGLACDPLLWADLLACDPDDREALDAIADQAFVLGDGHAAAQKGTDLHALSEYVDSGDPLPRLLRRDDGPATQVTLQDRADMAAYAAVRDTHGLTFTDAEVFVVYDRYGIGGTFDRRAIWPAVNEHCPQRCGLPVVFDLKTGRIDYGEGKIGQQLAVYANSERYDPRTGQRSPLEVCTHVGLVLHLPQGTGTASLHSVDIAAGLAAVATSDAVRRHRRESQGWITPLSSGLLLDAVRSSLPSKDSRK